MRSPHFWWFAVASAAQRPAVGAAGSGFVLFRLFDILKPAPIGWIERRWPNAVGVMLDDLNGRCLCAAGD